MINKIFDASVLLDLLKKCDFIDMFRVWGKKGRYELWVTDEVNREIKDQPTRQLLDRLIKDNIFHVFQPILKNDLEFIRNMKPSLSMADCSTFFLGNQMSSSIILTNDLNLRKLCQKNQLEIHGSVGIYNKLVRDTDFSSDEIEVKFAPIKNDPRIFPKP